MHHDALFHMQLLNERFKKRLHLPSLLYAGLELISFQDLTLFHQAQPVLLQFHSFKFYFHLPHIDIYTTLRNLRFHISAVLRELCVSIGLQFFLLETILFQFYASVIRLFRIFTCLRRT